MKLLFITQIVDKNDLVQGIYHEWISMLAKEYEHLSVMCLYKGGHTLPDNVTLYSLGKETYGAKWYARLLYLFRFYKFLLTRSHEYDRVLVHMNEEYVILGKPLWSLFGKRVSMWRNHYAGSWRTALASRLCHKVFYTSDHSYTARFKNAVKMPVGVDTTRFKKQNRIPKKENSILFLSRMSPSKRPHIFVEALLLLKEEGITFTATVCGSPIKKDVQYYKELMDKVRTLGLSSCVTFLDAVPNSETPALYQSHELFVNCSPSGMFDKTLFEAAACGDAVFAVSDDLAELTDGLSFISQDNAQSLAQVLKKYMASSPEERDVYLRILDTVVVKHSFSNLMRRIVLEV